MSVTRCPSLTPIFLAMGVFEQPAVTTLGVTFASVAWLGHVGEYLLFTR